MTLPEVMLWECLRGNRLAGARFRRQHPVGPYVLDFYCPAARLAVEVDGAQHDLPGQLHHDARRDRWIAGSGIGVMRIAAADVLDERALEGVLPVIVDVVGGAAIPAIYSPFQTPALVPPPPPPSAVPLPRFAGEDQAPPLEDLS